MDNLLAFKYARKGLAFREIQQCILLSFKTIINKQMALNWIRIAKTATYPRGMCEPGMLQGTHNSALAKLQASKKTAVITVTSK